MPKFPQLVKAGSIVAGHIKEVAGLNNDLFTERYAICADCPSRKTPPYGEICGECGCRLQAKLRIATEVCPLNKWN